jgi:GT2 family glycosyltransferase
MPDVLVAIVSFNTKARLATCLESVLASVGVATDVRVFDNRSHDGSPDLVASAFPTVGLVRSARNVGFAAANNQLIAASASPYVLLLNPDTEFPSDAIRRMVAFMDAEPSAAICGPQLLNTDGSRQSCGKAFPTLSSEIRRSRSAAWLARRLGWSSADEAPDGDGPREVDWVSGACLLIRRSAIDRIGPMDEQFFIYAEELDWCFRARRLDLKVYALPGISVTHHEGQSTRQVADDALKLFVETRLRFYRKHKGLGYAGLVSLVYVAGCFRQLRKDGPRNWMKLDGVRRWWRSCLLELTAPGARVRNPMEP